MEANSVNQNILISVIVPVYNVEKYLNTCIESIVNQEYKNIEILLIDDGSTDNSGVICDEWASKDNRIKVFHQKNSGVSASRNLGIQKAEGKYFICIDSDDYVKPDHIRNLVETREKYPYVGHIWCCFETVTGDNEESATIFVADDNKDYSFYDRNQIYTLKEKWLGCGPCYILYDRDVIIKHNIKMDTSLTLGEDTLFNYEYLDSVKNTKIVISNKATYCYRYQDNGTLDTKYYDDLLDKYEYNMDVEKKYLEKWNVSEKEWDLYWNSRFYLYEKVFRNTFRKENQKLFLKKLKYNSDIMKSESYKNTYSKFSGYINPLFKKAYKSNSYVWVYMLSKISRLKSYLLRSKSY